MPEHPRSGQVAIVGCGRVGDRAARQLLTVDGVSSLLLFDEAPDVAAALAHRLGARAITMAGSPDQHADQIAVALVATPPDHSPIVASLIQRQVSVVSTSDSPADVQALLGLNDLAVSNSATLLVGAGFAPGLTDVLARHAAAEFAVVREVHTAKLGTAGPACARQHHAALSGESADYRDGEWLRRPGGTGRELVWFPDPIGGADCYRAALPDAYLLHRLFPEADRLSGRMAATRRDRMTSRLPMMRKPHAEAGPGAVRVEVRGAREIAGGREEATVVMACMDRPSVAAGAVAALAVGSLLTSSSRPGCFGLGEWAEPVSFLRDLATRGVRCARFEGTTER